METREIKEIINLIKREPFSVLIIFSLLVLPVIFFEWLSFFPSEWQTFIVISIIFIWIIALFRLRREILIYRRKKLLYNYLLKYKQRSIDHLTKEWAGSDDFTDKNIKELVSMYPDVFKYSKIKKTRKDAIRLVKFSD